MGPTGVKPITFSLQGKRSSRQTGLLLSCSPYFTSRSLSDPDADHANPLRAQRNEVDFHQRAHEATEPVGLPRGLIAWAAVGTHVAPLGTALNMDACAQAFASASRPFSLRVAGSWPEGRGGTKPIFFFAHASSGRGKCFLLFTYAPILIWRGVTFEE